MDKRKSLLGRLSLLGAALIWGTSFVILKNALDSIAPMWILAIRFTVAALLLGVASRERLWALGKTALRGGVLMGLSLAAAYIIQTYGLLYTTPGKNAFLTDSYCILVPFMAWGLYRRKPTAANILAALLCITGIGFVSLSDMDAGINVGDVLTLICGVFYGLQIILVEHYVGPGDALSVSAVQFAVGAVCCWIGALLFEPAPGVISPSLWLSIAYMSVACTALCFFLEAWGMKYTSSAVAAVILTLESVFGTVISVLFYHERLTVKILLGFALIFISVLISELKPELIRKDKTI